MKFSNSCTKVIVKYLKYNLILPVILNNKVIFFSRKALNKIQTWF